MKNFGKKNIFLTIWFIFFSTVMVAKSFKIVGLVQARNEEDIIEQCLRGLAVYADAIILLDDNSSDNTRIIAERLSHDLCIEKIIAQPYSGWQKTSEASNRQQLLDEGRAIGGTHFILIDADELFMAPCSYDNWLRNTIFSLVPGQVISFPMVNVWSCPYQYRDDEFCSPFKGIWRAKPMIFCDDTQCQYVGHPSNINSTKMLHGSRVPINLVCAAQKKELVIEDLNHGVVHFKWVHLENIRIKKLWYILLEYIRANEYNDNKQYNLTRVSSFYNGLEFKGMLPDEKNLTLVPVPSRWYDYSFFNPDSYMKTNMTRKKDIEQWISQYGIRYFTEMIASQK